jgi:hypothetical protein
LNLIKTLGSTTFGSSSYNDINLEFDTITGISGYYIRLTSNGVIEYGQSSTYQIGNIRSYEYIASTLTNISQIAINFNYKHNSDIVEITRSTYDDTTQVFMGPDEVFIESTNTLITSNKVQFNSSTFTNAFPYSNIRVQNIDLIHRLRII